MIESNEKTRVVIRFKTSINSSLDLTVQKQISNQFLRYTERVNMKPFTSETARLAAESRASQPRNPKIIPKAEMWRSIRNRCVECVGTFSAVSQCEGDDWVGKCPLHPYRFGKRDASMPDVPTRKPALRKAIRLMCNQCMSASESTNNLPDCGSEVCNLRQIRWQS